ncbi:MAG TPA: hypothetical protein VJS68_04555, partial [Thermoplasmata archaeon]|nr:hypothetical protein [Thermoplasmata archaeon]
HVPFTYYLDTIYALSAFFAVYFGLRLAGRIAIHRVLRRHPEFSVPVPTSNPLSWLLLSERKNAGRETTTFARYRLGRGLVSPVRHIDVPIEASATTGASARTAEEALAHTYPLARKASSMLEQTYHFADVAPKGSGGWEVVWYSLEFTAFGRAAAVRVTLGSDGRAETRRAWHTPLWRRELT